MSGTDRAGLSLTRLERIGRSHQRDYVDRGLVPGTLTQVWRKGELAYSGMTGAIDMERSKPMREDAIFRIYSMTKPITAVALMMLVEEGRLSLSDEVESWIPSWKGMGVYASGQLGSFKTTPVKRPMRVIDLCTHTSGLTYGSKERTPVEAAYAMDGGLGVAAKTTEGGLDAMIEQLAGVPLVFSPGDAWNYSVSIDVMGYLVQKISGQSFGEFLRTRIFEPLGMVDTAFWCPPEKIDRFASCYQAQPDGALSLQDDAGKSTYATAPNLESGGGGLVSTAADYMRFCRMMLNGGELDGARILGRKSVAMFSVNYLPGGREHGRHDHVGLRHPGRACRLRLFARLRRQHRSVEDAAARFRRRVLLERGRFDLFLDRPARGSGGGLHDAGDVSAVPLRHAPPVARDGLFRPDRRAGLSRGPEEGV